MSDELKRREVLEKIRAELFAMQDEEYRRFSSKLMPNVEFERVIGVRTPQLRAYAKKLAKTENAKYLLDSFEFEYYEEKNLHAMVIETIKDYDECIAQLDKFLPYVDNWATCDLMNPKIFGKNKDKLISKIKLWIADDRTYTKRFGMEMLMTYFLDDDFKPEYSELVWSVRSEEYYVNMMTAWFFATALAKQYEATIPVLLEKRLSPWTHNKTIQKAIESYRISDETKAYLRTLKIKESKNEKRKL